MGKVTWGALRARFKATVGLRSGTWAQTCSCWSRVFYRWHSPKGWEARRDPEPTQVTEQIRDKKSQRTISCAL